jgi:transcriptional regulator with XRE-family HTH domain
MRPPAAAGYSRDASPPGPESCRKKTGLTQQELARRVGLARETEQDRARTPTRLSTVTSFASALQVMPSMLTETADVDPIGQLADAAQIAGFSNRLSALFGYPEPRGTMVDGPAGFWASAAASILYADWLGRSPTRPMRWSSAPLTDCYPLRREASSRTPVRPRKSKTASMLAEARRISSGMTARSSSSRHGSPKVTESAGVRR